jgi:hypothetical protein
MAVEKVIDGIFDNERDNDIVLKDLEAGYYQCFIHADWLVCM